jgi:hypothetical protein
MAAVQAINNADPDAEPSPEKTKRMAQAQTMQTLGAWRYSQSVYTWDPRLLSELTACPLTDDVPLDIFLRLPEWGAYIMTPGFRLIKDKIHGVYPVLDWNGYTGEAELRIALDMDRGLGIIPLPLGNWSLREAVARLGRQRAVSEANNPESVLFRFSTLVGKILPLILYLCTGKLEVDINGKYEQEPPHARLTPAKSWKPGINGRDQPIVPPCLRVWRIGNKLGRAIKTARSNAGGDLRPAYWQQKLVKLPGTPGSDTGGEERLEIEWHPPGIMPPGERR